MLAAPSLLGLVYLSYVPVQLPPLLPRASSPRLNGIFANSAPPELPQPPQQPQRPPAPKAPLSSTLIVLDASLLVLYSLSLSIWGLLCSGKALESPFATMDLRVDLSEVALDFNSALSLAFAWIIGG